MTVRRKTIIALSLLVAATAVGDARSEEKTDTMRVFYFGNSLTGSAMPGFHEELGKSAGKQWICDVFAGAGWPTWMHRNELWRAMGRPIDAGTQSASSRGDLTLDDDLVKSASFKPKKFVTALGKAETIATAKRLLITTMARMVDKGTRFDEFSERPIVRVPPKVGPLVIEPVNATFTLKGVSNAKVFALDHDGRKLADAAGLLVEQTENGLRFTVDGRDSKSVYYLVEILNK
jgi:hypothetical protein